MFESLQHWDVFKEVSEVFILVPALLGLKGNLEMTLASRLSTQVGSLAKENLHISLVILNGEESKWLFVRKCSCSCVL